MNDTDRIRAIEEHALAAWPALLTAEAAGWRLRAAGGYSKRANSANALSPQGAFEAVRAAAEAFYDAAGLPPVFRLTPLAQAEADDRLADRGYRRIDESVVKIGAVPEGAGQGVTLHDAPVASWCAAFAEAKGVAEDGRALHDRMLAAIALPIACASLEMDGRTVAFGLGVAGNGWLGLFDVLVVPEWRRRGLARRVIAALGRWGRERGAEAAYLQVTAANAPARALYRDVGFREAYRYHYRVRD